MRFYENASGLRVLDPVLFTPAIKEYLVTEEQFILKLVKEIKPGIVLDIGCGKGYYATLLAPHVGRFLGIDYSQRMIHLAKNATSHIKNVEFYIMFAHEIYNVFYLPLREKPLTQIGHSLDIDLALFTWNTLGNISAERYKSILGQLARLETRRIIISTYLKTGAALIERLAYYKNCGLTAISSNEHRVRTVEGFISSAVDTEALAKILERLDYKVGTHPAGKIGLIVMGNR